MGFASPPRGGFALVSKTDIVVEHGSISNVHPANYEAANQALRTPVLIILAYAASSGRKCPFLTDLLARSEAPKEFIVRLPLRNQRGGLGF